MIIVYKKSFIGMFWIYFAIITCYNIVFAEIIEEIVVKKLKRKIITLCDYNFALGDVVLPPFSFILNHMIAQKHCPH